MRRSARAGTGGLPRRTEALRRADAEEDRDEALWRSAPRARAADAMVPWWPRGRKRARQLFGELRRPGAARLRCRRE